MWSGAPSVGAVALVLALAGCGGASGSEPAAADTASGSGSAESADTRAVAHDRGETQVPAEPQRVVVLDSPHLDAALSLGVTPVGSVQSAVDEGLPAYLGDRTEGVELVGTIEEPDLEAIASLQPDLILSATVRHEQIYDQLTQIAPTVFTAGSGTNWREGFELVADALGRAEAGDAALAEYDERVDAVGAAIGADDVSASIVRFLPDETRLYGPQTFSGSVLTDVGFDLPALEYDEYSMAYISPEQIGLADADVVFSTAYGDAAATTRDAVTAVWQTLPAVQNGCQFDVDDGEWMIGIGLIGAGIVLDDLESALDGASCG